MNRIPKKGRSIFHNKMFELHTHVEQAYEQNPDQIVYTEKDVLELMRLVRLETLCWAAENAKLKNEIVMNWHWRSTVDQQSILKGVRAKKLKI